MFEKIFPKHINNFQLLSKSLINETGIILYLMEEYILFNQLSDRKIAVIKDFETCNKRLWIWAFVSCLVSAKLHLTIRFIFSDRLAPSLLLKTVFLLCCRVVKMWIRLNYKYFFFLYFCNFATFSYSSSNLISL